ncbi:zinc ABC transporter substrate-binding protein [Falsirhodobacter sp. alg1]|uniref:zinc ABC transporter substrate-binding protein n=1 Tax=Falsirhodobacter sp. alg1 TaxID=1472418 RepID=UPI0005EDDAE7|nr:zinc ABC transporter substrate-binding protein [Falsirhodobacter sp. alg1]
MRYTISLLLASLATPALAAPSVVTDIAPVTSLVSQVMGTTGKPTGLLPAGADPHHFQMRPSQAGALQDADLVIWLGPEMTPWLTGPLEAANPDAMLRLLNTSGLHLLSYADDDHDDHDDHGHDDHGEHDHEGHDHEGHDHADHDEDEHHHEGTDPHAWLNPENAVLWLDAIATELSEIDPENAETYRANANAAIAATKELDEKLAAQLAPVADQPIVLFHDAYNYLADHYGLNVAGAISAGDASSPSAARLAEIRASAGPATCIFPEKQHDPKLAQQMADDAGVHLGGALDPEGTSLTQDADLYATMMQDLVDTLTDCMTRKD